MDIMDDLNEKHLLLENRNNILKYLILIASVIVAIIDGLNFLSNPYSKPGFVLFALLLVLSFCYILNQYKKSELALILASSAILIAVTINMVIGRGLLDPGILTFPVMILIGGFFLGSSHIVAITATTSSLICFVGVMGLVGYTGKAAASGLDFGVMLVLNVASGIVVLFVVVKQEKF